MSKENVKLFYEALAKDKTLQGKSIAIGKKYEEQNLDEKQLEEIYQKELVPLAREAGYDFTLAELKEYAAESGKPAMRELSEDELTGVAGGSVCACVLAGLGNFGGDTLICAGFGYFDGSVDGRAYTCACAVGGGGGWH